jgi:hypothetical protein
MTVALLVLAAATLVAACAAATPSDAGDAEQPIESVLAQAYSGLSEKRREVVRDQAAWARLWDEIHAASTPAPERPAVDFARDMLIAVAAGTRPSGGFSIAVQGVVTQGSELLISVHETCPAPGAMVTMGLTQPVAVVRVPRLTQAAKFRETRGPSCR